METKQEPTEAQKELQLAQQKERDECWKQVSETLEKYGYRFSVAVHISDVKGIGFIVDIVKKQ
jgi:hypothetical protein